MRTELLVVGAGPAGMAAAAAAAEGGVRVVLVDSGDRPGGQYFRHTADGASPNRDWAQYELLAQRINAQQSRGNLTYLSRCAVWSLSDEGEHFVARLRKGERTSDGIEVVASHVVLATGAHDVALAFDGWDAPGSMTVGGLQSLIKGQGLVAGKRIVIAGTGPFLLATAADVLKYGGNVVAVVEAHSFTALSTNPFALLAGRHKIAQAVELLGALRRAKTQMIDHATVDAALRSEDGSVCGVTVRTRRGSVEIDCDVIATGWGFEPNVELAVGLGLETFIPRGSGRVAVRVDDNQTSSHPRVWVAGELAGVAGSDVAIAEGEIAGNAAAQSLGRPEVSTTSARHIRKRGRKFAEYLLWTYSVPPWWTRTLPDQTMLCRCEEVTVGEVRRVIEEYGAADSRAVKLFARVGMGWCQGRMCATNCADLIFDCTEVSNISTAAAAQKRTIASPIPLSMLAEWDSETH